MAGTTADLVASIRRRTGMPAAQATYTAAELLAIASEELVSFMVPLVLKQQEDYWLRDYDVALVDGTTAYRIPHYAVGNKLRDVQLVDASGNTTDVPRYEPSDLHDVSFGFWIQGDRVNLVNRGTGWQYGNWTTLRLPYTLRPRTLVDSGTAANVGTITAFDATAKTITVTPEQTTWPTASTAYDLIRSTSPYEVIGVASTATRAAAVLTFAADLPADLAAGDVVCRLDASVYPQLPIELHPLLAQKVACRILNDKQMTDKLKAAEMELARMRDDAIALLSPRVDGESPKVVGRGGLHRLMGC